MAIKKQPKPESTIIPEDADLWLRQFLKIFEFSFNESAQALSRNAITPDWHLATLRAVKATLRDSGMDEDTVTALFAKVAFERTDTATKLEWNTVLNKRRFELIDGDIQGTLGPIERLELASLTQLMREQIDTEVNLPLEGAQKLHRRLSGVASISKASEP